MTFAEAKTAVQDYLGTTGDVSQCVKDSIRALSNFFWMDDENAYVTTVPGQISYWLPIDTLRVYSVAINGQEYEECLLSEIDRFTDAVNLKLFRFYTIMTAVVISVPPTAVYPIYLRRRRSFAIPTADADVLEVPSHLIDLMLLGAVQRFWRKIVAQTATTRELFPDVTPKEAAIALAALTTEYTDMLRVIRIS